MSEVTHQCSFTIGFFVHHQVLLFHQFCKEKNERRRRINARVIVMRTKISQTFFHREFANFGKFFFHSLQSFFFLKKLKKVGQILTKKIKNFDHF